MMNASIQYKTGRAAEHLVVADLILQGVQAFMVHGALPYDVLADFGDMRLRVQVKSTECARTYKHATHVYRFGLRHGNVNNCRRIDAGTIDVLALVAIDIRKIAYFHVNSLRTRDGHLKQTVDLRDAAHYEGRLYLTGKRRKLSWHRTFAGHEQFGHAITVGLSPEPFKVYDNSAKPTPDEMRVYYRDKARLRRERLKAAQRTA